MDQTLHANATREPIAIIGVGCRFPGASDLESLWHILRDGLETVGEYPGGRFSSLDRFYETESGKGGPVTRRGGFLKGLDLFDADFFGISPREAVLLDPQHRLLLELGWEALEDAGLPLAVVAGSRTGVFVGQWTSDFETCINDLLSDPHLYSTTGSGRYAAAARLAYHFDLRGPNLTLDTACSSALVAVHLACQSLRAGECELALAGAVNLILRPEITRAYGSAGMLSPDGRCKFGDVSANGYVRSEAGGVVALKLLAHALSDRDPIHAVIRGSAINNDGRSSGLLVSPGREGQAAMIRAALRDASVSASEIDYIEAHGTGTAAGDPAELEAIGSVLADAPRNQPCCVGSVKTNLGHSEAAAGMVGLCKLIVSLSHATIPATLHLREPSPRIPWSRLPLTISAESRPWPHSGKRRIASVNSFGITGTNAHAILESAPDQDAPLGDSAQARLLVLSARTPAALEQTAASWCSRLAEEPSWPSSMADLAFTAAVRRTPHPFRLAAVAKDAPELHARLTSWLEHEPTEFLHSGKVPADRPRMVFVFPGQGGQWPGMGCELFEREPVFREAMTRCDRALLPHTGWSVIDALLAPAATAFSEIDRVQPMLFSLMIALAELWRSWGVEPDAVVGHSMGEAAAAVVCGALSLEDGAAVIAKRSLLMKTVSGQGLMAMAALTFAEATEFLRPYDGRISIAANNSPSSTVLSGNTDAVEEAIAALEAREVFCRRVQVDVASHCAQMNPLAPQLERSLAAIAPRRAPIPLYSTSTGRIEDGLSLGAAYWSRNLREPVLFSGAIQSLLRDGFATFLEINAHPVLLHAIDEGAKHAGKQVLTVASLRRTKEELPEMLAALGQMFVDGQSMDFRKLYPVGKCLRLPAYPWQRERYWPEEGHTEGRRSINRGSHPNLGAPMESSLDPGVHLFDVEFRPPADRLEAAGWCLDMILAASSDVPGAQKFVLLDVSFRTLVAPSPSGQLVVFGHSDGTHRFRLSAKAGETWSIACEGRIDHSGSSAATPVAGHPVSALPLTACLRTAAASLGSAEDQAQWSVSHIDRIEWLRADSAEHLPLQAVAVPVNETSAHGELTDDSGSWLVRMTGVHFDVGSGADCSRHIYQWKWKEIEAPSASAQPGGVFVITGNAGIAAQLAGHFSSRKIECVLASDADSVRDLVESLGSACRAVVWASAERTSQPESTVDQVWEVISLVQSMTAANGSLALWLVTTGAHQLDIDAAETRNSSPPSASQTAVWGLARVIAREHPEIRCISVDLSPLADAQEFHRLAQLAASAHSEQQLAIRGAQCYALRLERRLDTDRPEIVLREDASYLITGGLGDLGLSLAAFLAERGARSIALAGRRAPGPGALEKMARIEARGVQVRSFQADVAKDSEIASVLQEIGAGMAPLKGVFHLAGITQDAMLDHLSRESLEQVMRPKVYGAWNLHRFTAGSRLDHFVMYSSLAAVSSQPGQASYAAANACLDGLATLRTASGLPGTSIQWGPWKDAGMIRESGATRSLLAWAEQGIGALTTQTALDGVHRLLAHPVPVAFIAAVDWKRFAADSADKTSPLFSELIEPEADTSQAQPDKRHQLLTLSPSERATALDSHLKSILASVLKSKASRIDSASLFSSLGVDSLMTVEIARRITETLGTRLPVTALFNFPTLELLAAEVARRLDPDSPPVAVQQSAESPRAAFSTPLPAIAQMTDEEALESLMRAVEAQ
jgi:myxalamid-type polyketide synthase MxaE and MxaD